MNGRGGVNVCWGGGESGLEACAGRVHGVCGACAGRVRGVCGACAGRALEVGVGGVRGACVGRVCGTISVGIARSALLSGYLGKSGHLPRSIFFPSKKISRLV